MRRVLPQAEDQHGHILSEPQSHRDQPECAVMLGVGLSLPETPVRIRGSAAASPSATIAGIVVEGDSITSTQPSTPNGMYSYQYETYRADKAIEVRAQGSRTVGPIGQLNDNGNTLIGNLAEDLAYGPDLITAMLGANDLGFDTANSYRTNLTTYYTALKAANPAVKFAWSPPTAYNPTGTPHPNYPQYMADRANVLATGRDPAVWGQWADYYLPVGEYPDFDDATVAAGLFDDTVHPSVAGQALLFTVYKAAVDSILDSSRRNATAPYDAVWPADQSGLATSTATIVRFIVAGVAHTGLVPGIGVSGGGAQVRLGGRAWGTGTGRVYNGDVVDVRMTSSASHSTGVSTALSIGSETRTLTFTTAADVPQVTIGNRGGGVFQYAGSNIHSFDADLNAEGVLVVFTYVTYQGERPTSVTAGGVPLVWRGVNFAGLSMWTEEIRTGGAGAKIPTGGSVPVVLNFANGVGIQCPITWCLAVGADPVPVATQTTNRGGAANPQLTDDLTCPSKGVIIGAFALQKPSQTAAYTDTTVNAPGTQVQHVISAGPPYFQDTVLEMTVAARTGSGRIGWTYGYGASAEPINALVLKATAS